MEQKEFKEKEMQTLQFAKAREEAVKDFGDVDEVTAEMLYELSDNKGDE